MFKGQIGNDITRCTVIGGDGVRGLTISNCQFIDLTRPTDFAVHVENKCDNFVCTGNTFRNVAGGICFFSESNRATIADNIIISSTNRNNSDDPATFPTTGITSFGDTGILLVFYLDGSPGEVVVTGNAVEGFPIGISLSTAAQNILVSDNIFNLCTYGFRASSNTEAFVFENNRVSRSRFFGHVTTSCSITLGSNVMDRCPNFIDGLSSARNTVVQGLKIINSVSIAASAITKFNLIPTPVFGIGTYSGRAKSTSALSNEVSFYCNYRINSAGVLTNSNEDRKDAGSMSCPASGFLSVNASNLAQTLISTANTTLTYEVEFLGNLVFS
jgi:parallel beta-helix repeat protein